MSFERLILTSELDVRRYFQFPLLSYMSETEVSKRALYSL